MPKAPQFKVITTDRAVAINCYVEAPDTEAPEGASWKPNGKYKVTLVLEPGAMRDKLLAEFEAEGKARFPAADTVELPFKDGKQGTRSEGKTLFTIQSAQKPKVVDRFDKPIDAEEVSQHGDELRVRVALVPWEKDDEIKERINGKVVTTKTKVFGVAARIYGIQLVKKRPEGGGGFGVVDDEEGEGEENNEGVVERTTTRPARSTATSSVSDDDEIPF